MALWHSQTDSPSHRPQLRLVSLVVPATAAFRAQVLFDNTREIELSPNEKLFRGALLPADKVVEGFDILISECALSKNVRHDGNLLILISYS